MNPKCVPKEYVLRPLRECPVATVRIESPPEAAGYWRQHIEAHPYFNPCVECFIVLLVNTRRRLLGHSLIAIGTLDTVTIHPREVFRPAIIGAASAILLMHNHPSGDSTPSEADIKVTRDLIRAGQLLKIDVLDHVIVGRPSEEDAQGFRSMRELGYFYT